MMPTILHRTLGAALATAAVAMLAGCGSGGFHAVNGGTTTTASHALRGRVHGGQQPIAGATVQLYAVGITGPMSAATPLLNPAPTTNAQGEFNIANYTCPSSNSYVYIVSTGGNPGFAGNVNNPAAGLMAAIGYCDWNNGDGTFGLDPNIFLDINEITTVGSIYALAPYMSDSTHIGANGYSFGIANAFATSAMLMDFSAGVTPGPQLPSTVTYDPATGFPAVITTIANAIAYCINSKGNDGPCQSLFRLTTANGATPDDTIAATLAIAKNPGLSPTGILYLPPGALPYQPQLSNPPNDWTVALNYTGLNLTAPTGLAIDAYSDVWVADAGSASITELASALAGTGSVQYTGGGILGAQALAFDTYNRLWIANTAGNSVIEMSLNGTILSGTGYTGSGINAPIAIAMDSQGDAWVANLNGNSITELSPNGTPTSVSPITTLRSGAAISQPTGIAIDNNGLVWVSNSGLQSSFGLKSQIAVFDQYGNSRPFNSQTVQNPLGLAVDSSNNVWIASNGTSQLGAVNSSGATVTGETVSGGGLNQPAGVAVDGSQNVWLTNNTAAGGVSEFSSTGVALSPTTGFGGSLVSPVGIAIDDSGNVWTANSGSGSLTEFVGLGAPTLNPVITKILYGQVKPATASPK